MVMVGERCVTNKIRSVVFTLNSRPASFVSRIPLVNNANIIKPESRINGLQGILKFKDHEYRPFFVNGGLNTIFTDKMSKSIVHKKMDDFIDLFRFYQHFNNFISQDATFKISVAHFCINNGLKAILAYNTATPDKKDLYFMKNPSNFKLFKAIPVSREDEMANHDMAHAYPCPTKKQVGSFAFGIKQGEGSFSPDLLGINEHLQYCPSCIGRFSLNEKYEKTLYPIYQMRKKE